MQNSGNTQKPDMAEVRRMRHLAARRGEQVPGMPRNNPWLVAFLAIFVFLPLMFIAGAYLTGILTGDFRWWNFLIGLPVKLFTH
jgi:hypothetical protein